MIPYAEYKINKLAEKRRDWKIIVISSLYFWGPWCTQCRILIDDKSYDMSWPGQGHLYCGECIEQVAALVADYGAGAREWNWTLFSLFWRYSADVATYAAKYFKYSPKLVFCS